MFQKVNQIVMFAFMAIGLILMIMTMGIETTEDGCVNCGAEGLFIGFSYFLLVITLIAALAGTAMTAVSDPGKMKGTAIGIGAMILVFVVSYVLASGETYTIREFVESAFGFAGFNPDECRWEGEGSHSKYYHREKLLVKINPKYYRPAEVNLLLGDPTLAEKEMGWERKTDFYGLVKKMVDRDLDLL